MMSFVKKNKIYPRSGCDFALQEAMVAIKYLSKHAGYNCCR